MRVVFFGTPSWAVPSLEALAAAPFCTVSLVVTQPPKRRGRGLDLTGSPVARAAGRLDLPVVAPESLRKPSFAVRAGAESPDCFVVVAYGRIFPRELLDVPRLGAINVHFSLLPRYRGAAPVQWAIVRGETVSGVSTMKMVEELDAGPVYMNAEVPIEEGEHAPSLGRRLSETGPSLLLDTLRAIEGTGLRPRDQDPSRATYARLLTAGDAWIDWSAGARDIVRRVRGFDPWPGQVFQGSKGKIKVLEARPAESPAEGDVGASKGDPGRAGLVLGEGEDGSLRIACADASVLEALLVQPEGRRTLTGAEALRGRYVTIGERLGRPA